MPWPSPKARPDLIGPASVWMELLRRHEREVCDRGSDVFEAVNARVSEVEQQLTHHGEDGAPDGGVVRVDSGRAKLGVQNGLSLVETVLLAGSSTLRRFLPWIHRFPPGAFVEQVGRCCDSAGGW